MIIYNKQLMDIYDIIKNFENINQDFRKENLSEIDVLKDINKQLNTSKRLGDIKND